MSDHKKMEKPPVKIPSKPLEAGSGKDINFSGGEHVAANEKSPSINVEIRARGVPVPPNPPPSPPKK